MLNDVVQRDVRITPQSPGQRRHAQPRERSEGMLLRGERRKHQVEPNHIWLNPTNCVQQADWSSQIIKLPTPYDVKPGQFRRCCQRLAILISGELIIAKFIPENR